MKVAFFQLFGLFAGIDGKLNTTKKGKDMLCGGFSVCGGDET